MRLAERIDDARGNRKWNRPMNKKERSAVIDNSVPLEACSEDRRPGLARIRDEIANKNPTWPAWRVTSEAKTEWHRRHG